MGTPAISTSAEHLPAVLDLARRNRATLGFLPDAVFEDAFRNDHLLVATAPEGEFLGYLLYRIARTEARIIHLCVDTSGRGKGVAKALVSSLVERTQRLDGIGLLCRRDYEADRIWPKLGFTAVWEKPGRSKAGSILTFWWLDHGHPNLFTKTAREESESKRKAVVDANVFFSLGTEDDPAAEESKALLADWLVEHVALCITDEIYNEIQRNRSAGDRDRWRTVAGCFPHLPVPDQDFKATMDAIRPLFPPNPRLSDESDQRQLARAIPSGADYLLTQDPGLLKLSERIQQRYGLWVVRPAEFIIHLDEILRASEYQPVKLVTAGITVQPISADRPGRFSELFDLFAKGETKREFTQALGQLLAIPRDVKSFTVKHETDGEIALCVFDRSRPGILDVPLLRLTKCRLAPTLARHLVHLAVRHSIDEVRPLTTVSDPRLEPGVHDSLRDNDFFVGSSLPAKVNLRGHGNSDGFRRELRTLAEVHPEHEKLFSLLDDGLAKLASQRPNTDLFWLERALSPAKLLDLRVPNFIVPIQPKWAVHLFDEKLAVQELFGAEPELFLRIENAYYRSARPSILTAPARILWYVSAGGDYHGAKAIRACSHLDEVLVDTPKNLYRRFRRLGVYQWDDVFEISKRDLEAKVMAFRFSKTELLRKPISWEMAQEVLADKEGRRSQFQSPLEISVGCFERLYGLGYPQQ